MLNLSRQEQALTQGQPNGQRVVARAVQIDEVTTQPVQPIGSQAGGPGHPSGGPAEAPADPQAVARRVLELMREDLRVDRERRRPGR